MAHISVSYKNTYNPDQDVRLETLIQIRKGVRNGESMMVYGMILPYTKGNRVVMENVTYKVYEVIDRYDTNKCVFHRLVNVKPY